MHNRRIAIGALVSLAMAIGPSVEVRQTALAIPSWSGELGRQRDRCTGKRGTAAADKRAAAKRRNQAKRGSR